MTTRNSNPDRQQAGSTTPRSGGDRPLGRPEGRGAQRRVIPQPAPISRLLSPDPVALAFDLDDDGVMQHSIEKYAGDDDITKGLIRPICFKQGEPWNLVRPAWRRPDC
jgi:hypothetical protein